MLAKGGASVEGVWWSEERIAEENTETRKNKRRAVIWSWKSPQEMR